MKANLDFNSQKTNYIKSKFMNVNNKLENIQKN